MNIKTNSFIVLNSLQIDSICHVDTSREEVSCEHVIATHNPDFNLRRSAVQIIPNDSFSILKTETASKHSAPKETIFRAAMTRTRKNNSFTLRECELAEVTSTTTEWLAEKKREKNCMSSILL